MPLEEAVSYLARVVRRRVGGGIKIRFLAADSREGWSGPWRGERNLPLVIIGGEVCFRGFFPLNQIVGKLQSLMGKD